MPKEYRSRAQVVQEILAVMQRDGPIGITRLTSAVNLTHGRIQDHLEAFQRNGLVEQANEGERAAFRLTTRGSQALEELRRIDRAMQDFGLHI